MDDLRIRLLNPSNVPKGAYVERCSDLCIAVVKDDKILTFEDIKNLGMSPALAFCKAVANTREEKWSLTTHFDDASMWILDFENLEYGACVMFFNNILNEVAQTLNDDLVIFPSSVYEVLVARASEVTKTKEELRQIVYEVNREVLEPEERLSDSVYFYSREHRIVTKL